MPRRVMPDKGTLRWLLERGFSHQQIAEWVEEKTGYPVSIGTVASAVSRANLSEQQNRYEHHLPWRVSKQHAMAYPARMLRLMGRRSAGLKLTEEETERLESWLRKLEEDEAVVVYVPDTEQGFYYIQAEPDRAGIPVRKSLPAEAS